VALRMLPEQARPPVTVLGVQPAIVEAGMEPSAEVVRALPRLLREVRRIVRDYLAEHPSSPKAASIGFSAESA
jgi:hypothetical protein